MSFRSCHVLAFADTNLYGEATGGVFPVSNDGHVPDGVEQLSWPMPFLSVTGGLPSIKIVAVLLALSFGAFFLGFRLFQRGKLAFWDHA